MGGTIGAILAGGMSTRMGEPKHALRLPGGRTMIEHVAGILRDVCPRIVIISNEPILPGHQHIPDNFEKLGPIGGLEALLSSEVGNEYLVLPCDMPLLHEAILRALLNQTPRPVTAIRLKRERSPRPLPMRINPSVLPRIWSRIEAGELSIQGLLDELEVEIVQAPSEWEPALANINTPEEFASLARLIHAQRPND